MTPLTEIVDALNSASSRDFCFEAISIWPDPSDLQKIVRSFEKYGYSRVMATVPARGHFGSPLVFGFDPRNPQDVICAVERAQDLQRRSDEGSAAWVEMPGTGVMLLEDGCNRIASYEAALAMASMH